MALGRGKLPPVGSGQEGVLLLESRTGYLGVRVAVLVFVCACFLLLLCFYIPERETFSIHLYKVLHPANQEIHVYMGNQSSVNLTTKMAQVRKLHVKCRAVKYPRDDVSRIHVPDDKVPWSVEWKDYSPEDFTSASVKAQPVWADPDFRTAENGTPPVWNKIDGKVNRQSFVEKYELDPITRMPRNPFGRTGLAGRGCLGRWGPNHAADPIVTRWKRDNSTGKPLKGDSGNTILQFIAVQRRDSGEWAIPGGMVDPGEMVSVTLKREFSEEAMNTLEATPEERSLIEMNVAELFKHGREIYRGYVDDPRNTDNAWMETIAVNFHDDTGDSVGKFALHAGDDAVGVRWTDIHKNLLLFASHADFIQKVAQFHDADW